MKKNFSHKEKNIESKSNKKSRYVFHGLRLFVLFCLITGQCQEIYHTIIHEG